MAEFNFNSLIFHIPLASGWHGVEVPGSVLGWGRTSLCGVCMLSPCLRWFSPRTPRWGKSKKIILESKSTIVPNFEKLPQGNLEILRPMQGHSDLDVRPSKSNQFSRSVEISHSQEWPKRMDRQTTRNIMLSLVRMIKLTI